MTIGFAEGRLTAAFDLKAAPASNAPAQDSRKFDREKKFDVTDRLRGIWRPDEGGARNIVRDLLVVVMAGQDKDGPFALLALDQTQSLPAGIDRIRNALKERLGLAPDRVLFHSTHCHMSPAYDPAKHCAIVCDTVESALANRTHAELAALNLKVDGRRLVINRRVIVPGVGARTVMFNDDCEVKEDRLDATEQVRDWIRNLGGTPDRFLHGPVETTGPVDDDLQALLFRDAVTGKMIGTLVRFAAHPVIVSEKKVNGDISADYPGYLRDRVAERLGGIALFGQGPCGDLRPLFREYSHAAAKAYGSGLADRVADAAAGARWQPLDCMEFLTEPLVLPLRGDLPATAEEAEQAMDRIEAQFDAEGDLEKRRRLQNYFWYFYRSPRIRRMLRPEWLARGKITTALHGLRFNDRLVLLSPGEIFHATRNRMVKGFESREPVTLTLCNEEISYLPARGDFDLGGYEPSVCVAEPGSDDLYVDAAQRLLGRVFNSSPGKVRP